MSAGKYDKTIPGMTAQQIKREVLARCVAIHAASRQPTTETAVLQRAKRYAEWILQ